MKRIFIFNDQRNAINYVNAIKGTEVEFVVSQNLSDCKNCTHLLLCGGGDVSPFLYCEEVLTCTDVDEVRDLKELFLIHYFYERNLPILGICRGMQILNVAFGGTLKQQINDSNLHYLKGKDNYHFIENICGFTNQLYGDQLLVNSAHRQKVDSVAKEFVCCSFSDEGTCEAFYHKKRNILGVQFHPERMKSFGRKIYDYFIGLN